VCDSFAQNAPGSARLASAGPGGKVGRVSPTMQGGILSTRICNSTTGLVFGGVSLAIVRNPGGPTANRASSPVCDPGKRGRPPLSFALYLF
jgi:hypothetical protein